MKKSQLFKHDLSLNYVVSFFKQHLVYDHVKQSHTSNLNTFKKMKMFQHIHELQEYLTPLYFDSKQNYPFNIHSYKGYNVILRQLCNYFNISYSYRIKYIHSKYEIIYHIQLPPLQ